MIALALAFLLGALAGAGLALAGPGLARLWREGNGSPPLSDWVAGRRPDPARREL